MPITVKHLKVSTVPDAGDDTLVEPSDWNADHQLIGLGTMAEQNANNVAITGGTMSGVTVTGYIPTTEKGAALGLATLDAGGKVPVSELPAAVLGALSYQGTWDASTNTPTLTSSVGTKGYYYVVSVAGSTNLNGITDWLVGDWAVYNGSVWQKVDNTDAGGDVVGPASATDNAITRFDGTTGKLLQNSVVTVSDTGAIAGVLSITDPNFIDFNTGYTTPVTQGQLGWDGTFNSLSLGMIGGNVIQHIGEDTYIYVKASAAITKGQVVMFTGSVGASGVATAAPSTGVTNGQTIIGVAAENIALNGFGLIQTYGELRNINTSAFADGDILYYNSAVTGGFTTTYPASGPIVTVAAVLNGGSAGGGVITIRVSVTQRITASTGISVSQTSAGTSVTNAGVTSAVAGTGISVSGSTGAVTVTNTAPDQTVAIAAGTGISVSGTYPSFTVANTGVTSITGTASQVTASASTGGVTLSLPATINVNTSGSAATLTTGRTIAITGDLTYTSPSFNGSANVTAAGTLATVNANVGSFTNASLTVNAKGLVTAVSSGTAPVTSVTGTSPVVSSGGATPAISLASGYGDTQNPYASKTANNFLAAPNGSAGVPTFRAIVAADIPTLNQNTTGSAATLTTGRTIGMTGDVTWTSGSFNGSANVTGTATLATVSIAKGGTGQTTATAAFNALNPMTTTGDIIYEASPTTAARLGIGSTGQVLTVSGGLPAWAAAPSSNITTQGLYENSATISANYTIGSGNNAMSAGPITISTGVTVTVPTGSTWTVV